MLLRLPFLVFIFIFSMQSFAAISPYTINGSTSVDTIRAFELFESGAYFIDVRKDSDWDAGRIPGAIHLELHSNFHEIALSSEIKKDTPVIIYCNGENCTRSAKAAVKAISWGFTQVYYYRDGFPAWKKALMPIE